MSAGIAECLDKLDVFSSSHLAWIKKKDDPPLGVYDGVGYERLERTLEAGAGRSDDITMLAPVFGVPPEPRATVELAAEVGQLAHVRHLVREELRHYLRPQRLSVAEARETFRGLS